MGLVCRLFTADFLVEGEKNALPNMSYVVAVTGTVGTPGSKVGVGTT